MSSSTYSYHTSSSSRYPTVVHNHYSPSVSSTTTNSTTTSAAAATMSSRGSSSGSTGSRDSLTNGEFRDPRAGNYTGNYAHTSGRKAEVTVLNYNGGRGYDKNEPSPAYSKPHSHR